MMQQAFISFDAIVSWLTLFGVVVFAVSGALLAARKEMDILGFLLIGSATGLGGGTLRDLLLGVGPVYWVEQPVYIWSCLLASTITYFIVPFVSSRLSMLIWMDAIGLSLFSVTGVQVALEHDVHALVAVCMGVMTATFGGIVRDVLCGVSLVLRGREFYVTAAVAGASVCWLLYFLALPGDLALVGGFLVSLILRSVAILYGFGLPSYHSNKNN